MNEKFIEVEDCMKKTHKFFPWKSVKRIETSEYNYPNSLWTILLFYEDNGEEKFISIKNGFKTEEEARIFMKGEIEKWQLC